MIEGRLAGVVYLSQPLQDLIAVLHDMRVRWWLSMAVALVLSGAAGLALSGAIARPLRQLTAAAGAVARGQLDHQVPVRSRDELGRLSQAFNDMTARLRAARQMQTDFVANVSHELRTPLTAVKGLVETLRDGAVDDFQVRDRFLGTIENETDRLIRLVNDLLLLSRVDSDALNLRPEPVDVTQLAQATVDEIMPQAEAKQLAVQVKANPDPSYAQADPDRIMQVLLNLLDNAIKYSEPGGVVNVVIGDEKDGTIQIQVRDGGIGISAGDLPHVGERFYRADKARARTHGGSGLGLAIARALVELHGGRLWVESEFGRGTTVSLLLPTA
jgi:signal transduction histidine kinase